MMKNNPFTTGAVAVAVAVALAGCGGGGSSTTSTATPAVTIPTVSIVTSVPAATYAAGSPAAAAYAYLNTERQRCGFGLLAQNAQLDVAASAHANYLVLNQVFGHTEDPTKQGFYGATPQDRTDKAGYSGVSGENIGGGFAGVIGQPVGVNDYVLGAKRGMRGLMSAPYHAQSLLSGARELGVGISVSSVNSYEMFIVMELGFPKGVSFQGNDDVVRTYPCDGTTGTTDLGGGESPSPFPGEANQTWGQPIMIKGATDLRISSASIVNGANPVAIRAIFGDGQKANPNPNYGGMSNGQAVIVPVSLAANTSYTVTITGTNKGSAFTKTFTFTTGVASSAY